MFRSTTSHTVKADFNSAATVWRKSSHRFDNEQLDTERLAYPVKVKISKKSLSPFRVGSVKINIIEGNHLHLNQPMLKAGVYSRHLAPSRQGRAGLTMASLSPIFVLRYE